MNYNDLDYLRAELAQAQQMGVRSLNIRVTELQSLLDQIRVLSQAPKQPVKVMGFVRLSEAKQHVAGKLMTIRQRHRANNYCTVPVYYDPTQLGENHDPEHAETH